ncbi:chromosomal replication initiator protein dnaA [Caudoviricetes sp.]|nr:chromosomal replication initiator protein dnaA [Caudoviricetes sp.]UOF81490.1 chromosomal replication initiator protein dnaA [Caudoviricetes sp.]
MSIATEIHQQTKDRRARLGYIQKAPAVEIALIGRKPRLPYVKDVVIDQSAYEVRATYSPSLRAIARAVADHYQVPVDEMLGLRRLKYLLFPRQIACYLAKTLLPKKSYPEIGRSFGKRDHTTILYAVKKIDRLIQCDPKLAATITFLAGQLHIVTARHVYWGA